MLPLRIMYVDSHLYNLSYSNTLNYETLLIGYDLFHEPLEEFSTASSSIYLDHDTQRYMFDKQQLASGLSPTGHHYLQQDWYIYHSTMA